jgi:hypothetical protein
VAHDGQHGIALNHLYIALVVWHTTASIEQPNPKS